MKKRKQRLSFVLSAVLVFSLCVAPANALEYTINAPEDYLFGRPTSDDTIYEWENPNVDLSKNAALIPPGFGTPTSYLPGSGEYLTPNLVPGTLDGGLVGGGPEVSPGAYPTVDTGVSGGGAATAFTEVTGGMYFANGSLGTLKIPSIGLTVGVYEGTGSAPLLKGAGHFEGTSIWAGNVCVAGHNRGVRNDFGKIHLLKPFAAITFTTVLGTRSYAVASVTKVAVTDVSGLAPTSENQLTLYTCVENQPAYRWCVRAVER